MEMRRRVLAETFPIVLNPSLTCFELYVQYEVSYQQGSFQACFAQKEVVSRSSKNRNDCFTSRDGI